MSESSIVKLNSVKSIMSFGFMGGIIGLIIGVFSQGLGKPYSIEIVFGISGLGFICGIIFGFFLMKLAKMTEEDWMKGLSFECSSCKGSVYEVEQKCKSCGETNKGYNQDMYLQYEDWKEKKEWKEKHS